MKILLFALLFCSGTLLAQNTKTWATTTEVDAQVAQFMALVEKQEFATAFKDVKPYWPLAGSVVDDLANTTISQLSQLEGVYGKMVAAELVTTEKVGTFAYTVQYVLKYEYSALRFSFYYYNSGSGWLVNSVSFDEKWEIFFKGKYK